MLKKCNRLKSKKAFSATYFNKNTYSSNLLILYTGKIKTDKNCPTRVGFVVSKKIHKRAVIRNKIKRLMRENVRLILKNNEFPIINEYYSFIFVARSEILNKNNYDIRNTILQLLKKLTNKNL